MSRSNIHRIAAIAAVFCVGSAAVAPDRAAALEPLDTYIRAARRRALDAREAALLAAQAQSRAAQARARLLPSVVATAGYTRNSSEASMELPGSGAMGEPQRTVVITPRDQWDAQIVLSVPLVDVGAWTQLSGAGAGADAAAERTIAARDEVEIATARAYYQLLAAVAVRDSARRSLRASEDNRAFVAHRAAAGVASELDAERARAETEQARQTEAEAALSVALARQSLQTLTAIPARVGAVPELDEDLSAEPGLRWWLSQASDTAAVRAARADARAAELGRDAAWQSLLPTVSATAGERLTNAAGFGSSDSWAAGVSVTWTLDLVRPATIVEQSEALELARVRRERAVVTSRNAIRESWLRVGSSIARARAVRSQSTASAHAAEIARARYRAGTATQLEVVHAERDAFGADVARIQADADLAFARHELRVRSGLDPDRRDRRGGAK